VPGDAKPGTYAGTCRISAGGVPEFSVPLRVEVRGWSLPPPQELRTWATFHESPESVAMYYGVPLWSEEHFRLLGESYKWLGSVGCKNVFAHLIEHTNLGNERSILRWVRKKGAPAPEPGKPAVVTLATHDPDYTALDRYLDVAITHLGKPPAVCLYAWDNYCGAWYGGGAGNSHNTKPSPVKLTEIVGGKPVSAIGPSYENVEEAAAFWKPVGEHVREFLRKRGLEKSLMIGVAHDHFPGKYVVDAWKKALPEAQWVFEGHPRQNGLYGVRVGYGCTVWGASLAAPVTKRGHGWNIDETQCHFDRDNWREDAQTQLLGRGHLIGELNITGDQRGFGRVSADLWPALKAAVSTARGHRSLSISARYPETDWGACNLRMIPFLQPGPQGAISTGRLEMIREGLQECEARIFIEEALLDAGKKARVGPELEKRCWALLDRRLEAMRSSTGQMGVIAFLGSGRQERVRELFDLAGEVAAKLGR
jgi:hypothetical protein